MCWPSCVPKRTAVLAARSVMFLLKNNGTCGGTKKRKQVTSCKFLFQIVYTQITSWLHRLPDKEVEFYRIVLKDGSQLKLTAKHYIYKTICDQCMLSFFVSPVPTVAASIISHPFTLKTYNETASMWSETFYSAFDNLVIFSIWGRDRFGINGKRGRVGRECENWWLLVQGKRYWGSSWYCHIKCTHS